MDNRDAIGFALDQLLAAPDPHPGSRNVRSKALSPLGTDADDLIATLDNSLSSGDRDSLERLVAEVLRASGADVVAASPDHEIGADFAVWSDVLESLVGNPLLVEVKAKLRTHADVNRAARQLSTYLGASGSRWGLLLYGEGPDPDSAAWARTPPNVIGLPLRALLDGLRSQAFPELVRDLRNRRVHGSNS